MFSEVSNEDSLNKQDLNSIINKLYDTNFFKNIQINFNDNILKIEVEENPIIEKIIFEGIAADKIKSYF